MVRLQVIGRDEVVSGREISLENRPRLQRDGSVSGGVPLTDGRGGSSGEDLRTG